MTLILEDWQNCQPIDSDGCYTIGTVDDEPAEWPGNMHRLEVGQEYWIKRDGGEFDLGYGLYRVEDGYWCRFE